jgi:hypothetical protein
VLAPFDATERGGQRVARDFLDGAEPHNALEPRRCQATAYRPSRDDNSFDPTRVLKSGATLVRQWRGHTPTVLVREDEFV